MPGTAPCGDDTCRRMTNYVLDHHHAGEGPRLALMARLLYPMHRRYIAFTAVRARRPA
jgi:hypothetical protein